MCVAGSALALEWRGCSRFLCVWGELDGGGGAGWLALSRLGEGLLAVCKVKSSARARLAF